MAGDPSEPCAALVRRVDYDRYLSALFAPSPARPHLLALYAFNYEVAKTAEIVRQPIAGQIRLQWWRDVIGELHAGIVRRHDVVAALAHTLRVHDLPRDLFDGIIDAHENDLIEAPFADLAALEAYADATSGHVMRLAARILGAREEFDRPAREAGIAYALAGLLRALPFHAARRRLMLPAGLLKAAGLPEEEIFSGEAGPHLAPLIADVAERARAHLRSAREQRMGRRYLPAFLPAALVPMYLDVLTRAGFNPFRTAADTAIHRRQLAMLGAVLRGRL